MQRYKLVVTDLSKHLSFAPKGISIKSGGEYIIALDKSLAGDQLTAVYKHELAHVLLGHLDREIETATREREADEYAEHMTEQEFSDLRKYARHVTI